MWLASPFSYLCSAAAIRTSSPFAAGVVIVSRRRLVSCSSSSSGDSSASRMVPEDAASLLRAVYAAKPTPQVCVTTTGSGGQAVSWLLGVPGASACLLEATIPYSMKACEEKMGAGSRAQGYCSREAAEDLARDAYARAVYLCVAGSPDRGPHALPERRVIGVGCTAAVISSRPRRGLHHCFVCAQTADGLAHYELNLAKGRRDRSGEDAAVSRVLLQAIAEAVGVPVPSGFKTDHLLPEYSLPAKGSWGTAGAAGDKNEAIGAAAAVETVPTEMVPTADLAPEPDAIEELMAGRCGAVLIVPRDTRAASSAMDEAEATTAAAAASAAWGAARATPPAAVVLREGEIVRAALPRGTTVVLPGSYNPLHKGHVGLLEAARALLHAEINHESNAASGAAAASSLSTSLGRQERKYGQSTADAVYSATASNTAGPYGGRGGVGRGDDSRSVHGIFEVSVSNPDKGGLTVEEIRRRTMQFSEQGGVGWPHPVVVTCAPLFSQKARLFPGCAFVVGADTAKRIIDPRYYGNSLVEMVSALAEIRHLGCSFIVGGREDAGGRFLTLEGVLEQSGLPESLRSMFLGLDESAFRVDLSSSSIRAGVASPGL